VAAWRKERGAELHAGCGSAPSNELRKWFHARPKPWLTFRKRYLKGTCVRRGCGRSDALYHLADRRKKILTLLFLRRMKLHNNATVLRDLLDGMRNRLLELDQVGYAP